MGVGRQGRGELGCRCMNLRTFTSSCSWVSQETRGEVEVEIPPPQPWALKTYPEAGVLAAGFTFVSAPSEPVLEPSLFLQQLFGTYNVEGEERGTNGERGSLHPQHPWAN